jgi:dTDP-4-amino-4,6-dideoxygalactose transaminase
MRVPFFDMQAELALVRTDVDAAIARVLDSGVFIGGAEVKSFEEELARTAGVTHAVGVSSGTDALVATLMALGVGPGSEVVTTAFTFFATAGAATRLGARVVFAEIDDATLNLDPEAAAAACTDRTRAVIPVHLFGHPASLPALAIPIVEDAAQSLGGPALGGIAATLSFFPTKNVGAIGDAGAVLTNHAPLAERIKLLRTHGAQPKYHHEIVGGNFRLDAIQAAVLRAKLPHLAAWTARRRLLAQRYLDAFAEADLPALRVPLAHPNHAWHQFVIRAPARDALRQHLAEAGIGTEVYYPEPLHLQPCFADLGYEPGSLPVTERVVREVIALPLHPSLPDGIPDQVVGQIAAFYRKGGVRPATGNP